MIIIIIKLISASNVNSKMYIKNSGFFYARGYVSLDILFNAVINFILVSRVFHAIIL